MTATPDRPRRRLRLPDRRRAVVALPSGFTFANLFFGIFAIIAASRGEFSQAAWYVVLGGVADMFDGRIARATGTGSRLGEELDSLVDAISFGLAPAMIMYFAVLNKDGWDWIWAFLYTAAAVYRLARFNIIQAGRAKTHFQGLPSPAAGMTLATYYWFSQSPLYTQTAIGDLPWHQMLRFVMVGLAMLMATSVPYPAMPTISFKSARGVIGGVLTLAAMLAVLAAFVFRRQEFLFPALVAYAAFGVLKAFVVGFLERDTDPTDILFEEEDEDGRVLSHEDQRADVDFGDDDADDDLPLVITPEGAEYAANRPRKRRRRKRGGGGGRTNPQNPGDSPS